MPICQTMKIYTFFSLLFILISHVGGWKCPEKLIFMSGTWFVVLHVALFVLTRFRLLSMMPKDWRWNNIGRCVNYRHIFNWSGSKLYQLYIMFDIETSLLRQIQVYLRSVEFIIFGTLNVLDFIIVNIRILRHQENCLWKIELTSMQW